MMSEADLQILQSGTETELEAMLKRFNTAVSGIVVACCSRNSNCAFVCFTEQVVYCVIER